MNENANRSTFVTVVAWIFIVLAGFTTFISILQDIMISVMFSGKEMAEAMGQAEAQDVAIFFRFLFSNFRMFFFGILVVSGTTLASAIGLLVRKNWGRIVFIVVMALGIAWSLFAVVMQFAFFQSLPDIPNPEASAQFSLMFNIMRVFMLLMAAGVCFLFGWIIKKLVSAPIKAEFLKERVTADATTDSYGGSDGAPPAVGR